MTPLVIASLGFPLWLRLTHYINLLFIGLLIRSGVQIARNFEEWWRIFNTGRQTAVATNVPPEST
jgi:hypothetical protein